MKIYELTYIMTPEISSEGAEAKTREIGTLIQNNEGIILRQVNPSAKALAYPIKKSASGFISVLEFKMEPEKLDKLQASLIKDEKIVRQIIVIKEPERPKKEKGARTKLSEIFRIERKPEEAKSHESEKNYIDKEKIELKDIEQKLDELLGQ